MKQKLLLVLAAMFCILVMPGCKAKQVQDENGQENALHELLNNNSTVTKNLTIESKSMGQTMKYSVYLPPKFETQAKYPILYLLHGANGNNNDWLDQGGMQSIADTYIKAGGTPMVIVMPDGQNSFYWGNYEPYLQEELMPKVEADYGFNGKRAIAGLSMGGFGTLYHAFKYPQKYTYAYAMSPAVSLTMADMVTDPSALPGLTIETGEDDTTTKMSDITPFVEALRAKGVSIDYITRPGVHYWTFWPDCLRNALVKIGDSFKN